MPKYKIKYATLTKYGQLDPNKIYNSEDYEENFWSDLKNAGRAVEYISDEEIIDSDEGINAKVDGLSAELAQKVKKDELFINVKDYGAKGDGVTDDVLAIQEAINQASTLKKSLYLPKGDYIITQPLTVPAYTKIIGDGLSSVIIKQTTNTITVGTNTFNTVLLLQGNDITIDDILLRGDITNNVNGITFGTNSFRVTLNRVKLHRFKRAFHDFEGCWIVELNKVQCTSCEEGFSFKENIPKTMMTFKNCWAENCGQSYNLYRVNYSSFINCGADYANYLTDNPYGQGYGDQSTSSGVFNINLCRGITMVSCGMENCYGNGAVKVIASDVTINGLTVYFLKSDYVPNYTNEPNWGIGVITTSHEKAVINLSGLYAEGFTNTTVETNYPTKPKAIVANNYSANVYGEVNHNTIIVNGLFETSYPVFGGKNGTKNCVYHGDIFKEQETVKTATLENGWLNQGGGYETVGYYKDHFKRVHLQGAIKSGIVGQVCFTLPEGYRPKAHKEFVVTGVSDDYGMLTVGIDGAVKLYNIANTRVSLEGISFRV